MTVELDELNTSEEVIENTDTADVSDVEDTENNDDTTGSGSENEVDDEPTNTEEVDVLGKDNIIEVPDEQDNTDAPPKDIDVNTLSGIEQYLSNFNIDAGMISFEDGTSTHFSELDPEKQAEVLTKLHDTSAKGIEEKYGLDESEIGLINYLREQGKSIDEVVNDLATQRANTYIASKEVQTKDVDKMTEDEVYTSFLMRTNPNATAEQLEKDLEAAKKMSNFDGTVKTVRGDMIKEQKNALDKAKSESKTTMLSEIENQRKQVVGVVSKMKDVDGLAVNDGIKNDVLDLILNVDEDGDSKFMTDVFSDPQKLFKAAFWYKNGADIIANREEHWRKEKSAAYKRGLKDSATKKQTFVASDVDSKNKTTPHYGDYEDISSFDDLYNS